LKLFFFQSFSEKKRQEKSPNTKKDFFEKKITHIYFIGPKKRAGRRASDYDTFDNVMGKHTVLYKQSDGSIRTASYR
jgi:hypothetical protein